MDATCTVMKILEFRIYHKNLQIRTAETFAFIVLKFEHK